MPNNNQTGEAELAAVHSLEAARPDPSSYSEFYQQYGVTTYISPEGYQSTAQPVDGRVLHVDELQDRGTHLIVHELNGAIGRVQSRRRGRDGIPEQLIGYNPEDFLVVTFNGLKAHRWRVTSANSIHKGPLDAITQFIKPHNETMQLKLAYEPTDAWGSHHLFFNRGTGTGRQQLEHGYTGWILSAEESVHERVRLLQPQLGHIATAS